MNEAWPQGRAGWTHDLVMRGMYVSSLMASLNLLTTALNRACGKHDHDTSTLVGVVVGGITWQFSLLGVMVG